MIKDIRIYSRYTMDGVAAGRIPLPFQGKDWYLVSIYDRHALVGHKMPARKTLKDLGCKGMLSLRFWDVTEDHFDNVKACHPEAILFSEKQAQRVVKFVEKAHNDPQEVVFVAHCHAGISRSGAVGTFACDYAQLDYQTFLKTNPYIQANPYVLRLIRRAANMTPSFGTHDGVAPLDTKSLISNPFLL